MKKLLFVFIILQLSCTSSTVKNQQKDNINRNEIGDTIETVKIPYSGKWEKITEINGKSTIYTPIDASNTIVSVNSEDSINIQYGHEDITYKISRIERDNNTYHFHTSNNIILSCNILDEHLAKWLIPDNMEILATNNKNEIEIINLQSTQYLNSKFESILNRINSDMEKKGLKKISQNEFESKLNFIFGNIQFEDNENIVHYGFESEFNFPTTRDYGIVISRKHQILIEANLVQSYIDPTSDKTDLDHQLEINYHINNYLLNNNYDSFNWITDNYDVFFKQIVETFNFDKDTKINDFVQEDI